MNLAVAEWRSGCSYALCKNQYSSFVEQVTDSGRQQSSYLFPMFLVRLLFLALYSVSQDVQWTLHNFVLQTKGQCGAIL